jgi:hypothetical protein
MFEANYGQADSQVQFLARGSGYQLFLTRGEAVLAFMPPAAESRASGGVPAKPRNAQPVRDIKQAVVRMTLQGAKRDPHAVGVEQLAGKVNYLRGNDPDKWRTNVPTYGKVRYEDVYPGIDLVYYGHERQLEYDFIVAPGADPDAITLSFAGADKVDLDEAGDLVLTTVAGPVRFQKPAVYQERDGSRQSVAGGYVSKGPQRIGFRLADYDTTQPLIIDPVLSYSTYLGGSLGDIGDDIAVDGTGAAYVTGSTDSPDFPTKSAVQATYNRAVDAFVAKLTPDGGALLYATYLGGGGTEEHVKIAVDASGAAYITGETTSADFPTKSPLQQALHGRDAFVAKLTPDGTSLVYATYLGGNGEELTSDIAIDLTGAVYITGRTTSLDFPTTSPFQPTFKGVSDGFVAKLTANGNAVAYSTYLGGSDEDWAHSIAVDITGAAYLTGYTDSPDFPTKSPLQSTSHGFLDVFVAKLTSDGSALVYATYLGGSGSDTGFGIAVDHTGAAYVTGLTLSSDFPTKSPVQPTFNGAADAFVAKLTPDGTALVYGTYLGGTGDDLGFGIDVDASGAASITGVTRSADFLVVHPVKPDGGRSADNFVAKFTNDGGGLTYSITLGTEGILQSHIAVDLVGSAYVTGSPGRVSFPTTPDAVQPTAAGGEDAFVVKLTSAGTDVPVRGVNDLVALSIDEVTTSFDPIPVSQTHPAGTFRIVAGFDNVSSLDICNPFFQVVELPLENGLRGVWIEPGGQQIQGQQAYPVIHPGVVFASGSRMHFRFDIALPTTNPFRFFVNIWGTPQSPGTPCP